MKQFATISIREVGGVMEEAPHLRTFCFKSPKIQPHTAYLVGTDMILFLILRNSKHKLLLHV